MIGDDEETICRVATARHMIIELNTTFRRLTEMGVMVDLQIENIHTEAHGYGGKKTPRLHLHAWKEIE